MATKFKINLLIFELPDLPSVKELQNPIYSIPLNCEIDRLKPSPKRRITLNIKEHITIEIKRMLYFRKPYIRRRLEREYGNILRAESYLLRLLQIGIISRLNKLF